MEVANHRKKAAIVKWEPRIPTRNKNSQVYALRCTTDRGCQFCPNRELPLQQASNTLLTGDLRKTLMRQQDADNTACKTFPNEVSFLHNSLTESPPWKAIGETALTEMYQLTCTVKVVRGSPFNELCNSSLPDTVATQERISPVGYLGPSVLNRAKN